MVILDWYEPKLKSPNSFHCEYLIPKFVKICSAVLEMKQWTHREIDITFSLCIRCRCFVQRMFKTQSIE